MHFSNIFSALFLSIASGFVLTFLIQHEYEHKTIINVLAAPTSRTTFIMSKLVVWLLWYVVILGISILILIVGGSILFPDNFGINEIQLILSTAANTRILSFIATSPLLYDTLGCGNGACFALKKQNQ